jgi:hypothetical protein
MCCCCGAGTELCVFVVWTRTRTWLLHIPVNKPWLHALLHLLKAVHSRYVAPAAAAAAAGGAAAGAAGHESTGEDQQQQQQPADNLFWCDGDLALRGLFRRFITHTAQLSAAMSSDVLPDPVYPSWAGQQQQQQQRRQPTCPPNAAGSSSAQQRAMLASTPPPGWEVSAHASSKPSAGGGATAAPFWVHDSRLGVHHAMVRSVHLPWHRQQPLQRDRW